MSAKPGPCPDWCTTITHPGWDTRDDDGVQYAGHRGPAFGFIDVGGEESSARPGHVEPNAFVEFPESPTADELSKLAVDAAAAAYWMTARRDGDESTSATVPADAVHPVRLDGGEGHPAWCTAHDGFDDGSSDWHQSADAWTKHAKFYLSIGTITGDPEVFIVDMPTEGMALSEVRALAALLTAACDAAEAPEEVAP